MNELIMPHNVGVKNALENMKEVLALYKKVIGNYRPLLDGERYLTDKEVAQILKVSRRTLQEYRNDGVIDHRVGSSDHSDFFELNVQNVKATPMN